MVRRGSPSEWRSRASHLLVPLRVELERVAVVARVDHDGGAAALAGHDADARALGGDHGCLREAVPLTGARAADRSHAGLALGVVEPPLSHRGPSSAEVPASRRGAWRRARSTMAGRGCP